MAWVAQVCGGQVLRAVPTAGGNRCRSWAVDVAAGAGQVAEVFLRYAPPRPAGAEPYTLRREAQVYRAIAGSGVLAPRLIAEHPRREALLTSRAAGVAEFRHLPSTPAKQAIVREFMVNLARLHRMDAPAALGAVPGMRIADHVRAELATWRAMYEESGRADPLLELAFPWLDAHVPDAAGPAVLVHGDAGPGNFMFQDGRLTGLIDWELAHLGDPMEDLAWFSMRCVMEPVPDFAAALRDYESAGGAPVARDRVLYHRAFVSARVVVIRHRNVTGEPAHAIVSRALNRRLLVEALAEASGVALPAIPPVEAPATPRALLYERVIGDLRDVVAARSIDPAAIGAVKNAAKVIKYLQASDRYGDIIEAAECHALGTLLGRALPSADAGRDALTAALRAGNVALPAALAYFAGQVARDAQLAAGASGGIAGRRYSPL